MNPCPLVSLSILPERGKIRIKRRYALRYGGGESLLLKEVYGRRSLAGSVWSLEGSRVNMTLSWEEERAMLPKVQKVKKTSIAKMTGLQREEPLEEAAWALGWGRFRLGSWACQQGGP